MKSGKVIGIMCYGGGVAVRLTLWDDTERNWRYRESVVHVHNDFDIELGDFVWTQSQQAMVTREGAFADRIVSLLRQDWTGRIISKGAR